MRDDSASTTGKLPVISAIMRCCVGFIVIALLLVKPSLASVPSDSQLIIDSFNLFRSNNYPSSLAKLNRLLAIYPDTPLRDVALLLQAQASAKVGNNLDAAQAMVKFLREYPDSPLKLNANTDVMKLAVRLQRGEKLANSLSVHLVTVGNEDISVTRKEPELSGNQKAERERIARVKTEQERLAAAKAEEERLAREQAEQEKLARQRAEEEMLAAEKAERERIAAKSAERERLRREHDENERIAAQKLEDEWTLQRNVAIEMGRRTSTGIRVGTPLNTTAAAVETDPLLTVSSDSHAIISPPQVAPSSSIPAHSPPDFSMECFPPGENSEVARMVSIPFTITNLGAEPDRYRITTDLPTDFNVTFAAVGRPGRLLRETETIPPSSAFRGIMKLRLPGKSIDGQTFAASLTVVSSRDANVAISKKLQLVAAAPLLSSVIKPLKKRAAPGETVVYRLILMNVGSMTAREVAMKLVCPPALEPAAVEDNGFRQETDGSLVTEGIELPTGGIREFALTFRVGTTVAYDTTLSCRLDTENRQLGNTFTVTSGNVLVGP